MTNHHHHLKSPGFQSRAGAARQQGLSTIETLVVLAISGLVAAAAFSGMSSLVRGQRLQAVAAELESELQLARSAAVLKGQSIRLAIQPIAQGSCLIVHTGTRDACRCGSAGEPVCLEGAQAMHLRRHDNATGVAYATGSVSLVFSATHGTVTPTATLRLTDATGRSLHQVINVMGRIRTCSPEARIAGYKAC